MAVFRRQPLFLRFFHSASKKDLWFSSPLFLRKHKLILAAWFTEDFFDADHFNEEAQRNFRKQ
jgi:hypothetical protein